MEGLFINLNFRKVQWLLFGTYHQPSQKDSYYFNNLDKALDLYSHYDKKLSVGDFNTEVSDNVFSTIPYQHDLENLAKDKTCLKNANNPLASNYNRKFYCSFWLPEISVNSLFFPKNKPKEVFYQDYKNSVFLTL